MKRTNPEPRCLVKQISDVCFYCRQTWVVGDRPPGCREYVGAASSLVDSTPGNDPVISTASSLLNNGNVERGRVYTFTDAFFRPRRVHSNSLRQQWGLQVTTGDGRWKRHWVTKPDKNNEIIDVTGMDDNETLRICRYWLDHNSYTFNEAPGEDLRVPFIPMDQGAVELADAVDNLAVALLANNIRLTAISVDDLHRVGLVMRSITSIPTSTRSQSQIGGIPLIEDQRM